jgi:hypothetical protein
MNATMTKPERRNFLGIPVEGEITQGSSRVDQKPIEELQPLLQAVLDDPTVKEFGWRQYTPYFNDGDPCEFGVSGLWVRLEGVEDEEDSWELEVENSDHPIGHMPYTYDRETRKYTNLPYEGPDEDRYYRVHALDSAIQGGAFEHVLLDAFGDHASITVRRGGIEVESYHHD